MRKINSEEELETILDMEFDDIVEELKIYYEPYDFIFTSNYDTTFEKDKDFNTIFTFSGLVYINSKTSAIPVAEIQLLGSCTQKDIEDIDNVEEATLEECSIIKIDDDSISGSVFEIGDLFSKKLSDIVCLIDKKL